MYISDTQSTAVCTLPATAERTTAVYRIPPEQVRHSTLLKSRDFISQRVQAGDVMVLRGDTPHYGVANPDRAHRCVLFAHFAPRDIKVDTDEQVYPHGVTDY